MVQNSMVKLKIRRYWKVLPCRAPQCDIFTNKRYKARTLLGKFYVACCFKHAALACRPHLNGKSIHQEEV